MALSEAAAEEWLLEVRGLHTYFGAGPRVVHAVNGVSFGVAPGESVGIVGESGSGKSVASLSIMGLIDSPGRIAGGEIMFRGVDLLKIPEDDMRRIRGNTISMVFQEPMTSLNPVQSIGDQVAEVIRVHGGVSKRTAKQQSIELLQLVGISAPEQRFDEYPHQLSGGMRQRVMIAMAVANGPSLLILDEPTTALDVTIQAQILELIRSLQDEIGMAMLLITHNVGVIAEMSQHVIVMYAGKIMEEGSVAQVLKDPKHPYTRELLSSIPSVRGSKRRLRTIAGSVPDPLNLPPGCPFAPRCPHVMDVCRRMPPSALLGERCRVLCWLYDGGTSSSG